MMGKQTYLIGTYTDSGSEGIYQLTLDTLKGTLEEPTLFYPIKSPKALHVSKTKQLVSVMEHGSHAGIILLDLCQPTPYRLDQKLPETKPSCYINQDDQYVYTANYHEGCVNIYRKDHNLLQLEEHFTYGKEAKCHQVYLLENKVFVACLGLDRIKIYDRDNHFSLLEEIHLPKQSGPRHMIADVNHQFLYVLTELSNEIYVYEMSAHERYRCIQICSLLPEGCEKPCASAALRISSNGMYLYASTRGANTITCFEIMQGMLKQKEIFGCGGDHPRDFILEESGRWLLCCLKDSNSIVVFHLDPETGEAMEITDEKQIPSPVAIVPFG